VTATLGLLSTFPAATFWLSSAMKLSRFGGHWHGISTPVAGLTQLAEPAGSGIPAVTPNWGTRLESTSRLRGIDVTERRTAAAETRIGSESIVLKS